MEDNKIHEIRVIRKSESTKREPTLIRAKEPEGAFVEWEAPEYGHYVKGSGWFIWSAAIAVLLILFGMVTDSFLFVVIVVIAELMLLFWTTEKPPAVRYAVHERGIAINDRLIPYSKLFWFALAEEEDDRKKLVVEQKSKFAPRIQAMWVPPDAEEDIRAILQKQLEENIDYEERFIDTLARLVRF